MADGYGSLAVRSTPKFRPRQGSAITNGIMLLTVDFQHAAAFVKEEWQVL